MFLNENDTFVLPEPGVHRMKVVGHEVSDKNWKLKFGMKGFTTNGFGSNPYFKEDNPESWPKNINGWMAEIKTFFEQVMGREEVNRVIKEVETRIKAKYPTQAEQFETLDRVRGAVKLLLTELLHAATPAFKTLYFDVTLEEGIFLDKEGNEKPTRNIPKKSVDNNYYCGYKISGDQTPEIVIEEDELEVSVPADPTEQVPDWVNETPTRTEPTAEEW